MMSGYEIKGQRPERHSVDPIYSLILRTIEFFARTTLVAGAHPRRSL